MIYNLFWYCVSLSILSVLAVHFQVISKTCIWLVILSMISMAALTEAHIYIRLPYAHYINYCIFAIIFSSLVTIGVRNGMYLPENSVFPVACVTLGYKVDGKWKVGDIKFGHQADKSLFFNGVLCVRVMLPLYVGIGIRWAGKNPNAKEFMHTLVGWKLNGAPSIEFRVQSDASSAAGYTSPNAGQAYGWNQGTK